MVSVSIKRRKKSKQKSGNCKLTAGIHPSHACELNMLICILVLTRFKSDGLEFSVENELFSDKHVKYVF